MANTNKTKSDLEKELKEAKSELKKQNSGEVEQLKKQNEELQKKIEELLEQNTNKESGTIDIKSEDDILVVSLVPWGLSLYTDGNGKGRPYHLHGMCDEIEIPYGDLKAIVGANREMIEKGRFYIANEQACKKLRVEHLYKGVITPDVMKTLLEQIPERVVELYKMAPASQQKSIIDLIRMKKYNKEKINANIISELSAVSGINILEDQE